MKEIRSYGEYEKYKSDKNCFVRGYVRLGCYQGLDFYKKLNESEKLIKITDVEAFEDYLVFIISHIREIENQNAELKEENDELKLELSGYRQAILNDKEMLGLKEKNERLKNNWNELKERLIEYGTRNIGTSLSGKEYNYPKEIEVLIVLDIIQDLEEKEVK